MSPTSPQYPNRPGEVVDALFNDVDAAIRAGAALADTTVIPATEEGAGTLAVVVPDGYKLEVRTLDDECLLPTPRRKTGKVTVRDAASFLAYWGKHHDEASEVFADEQAGTVTGVINAHGSGYGGAAWGDHRVTLQMIHTPGWKRWLALSGKLVGQVEFAEHIEMSLPEVVEPSASDMLELAQTFEAKKSVDFESSDRLTSGERRLTYKETIQSKAGERGQIDIPQKLVLALTPWSGGETYRIDAHFRYRIDRGDLLLGYVLDRPEDLLQHAFAELVGQLRSELEPTPVLMGPAPA